MSEGGGLNLRFEGDVKITALWAAARLLQNVGDAMWNDQRVSQAMAAQQEAANIRQVAQLIQRGRG